MEFDNLKALSHQAMVSATKPWVEAGEVRGALAAVPETAGWLAPMGSAHNGLLRLQVTPSSNPEREAMSERALVLDKRYDRLARGMDLVCAGNALLCDPESPLSSSLPALRARLFPKGMRITQMTYLEEAGEAALVDGRLRPEDRDILSVVPTVSGNLLSSMGQWLATANELGELERDRVQKRSDAEKKPDATRAEVQQARSRWIKVVRAILTGLDLAENLDDKTRALILQPLRTAVEKASQKNKPAAPAPPAPRADQAKADA